MVAALAWQCKSLFVDSGFCIDFPVLDLITSPVYIRMHVSDRFQQPSTRVSELWQTDFTYFKIIGWGWYYLPTVQDNYSVRHDDSYYACKILSINNIDMKNIEKIS